MGGSKSGTRDAHGPQPSEAGIGRVGGGVLQRPSDRAAENLARSQTTAIQVGTIR